MESQETPKACRDGSAKAVVATTGGFSAPVADHCVCTPYYVVCMYREWGKTAGLSNVQAQAQPVGTCQEPPAICTVRRSARTNFAGVPGPLAHRLGEAVAVPSKPSGLTWASCNPSIAYGVVNDRSTPRDSRLASGGMGAAAGDREVQDFPSNARRGKPPSWRSPRAIPQRSPPTQETKSYL